MVSCEEDTEMLKKEMPEALEQESNGSSEMEEKEPTFQEALDSVRANRNRTTGCSANCNFICLTTRSARHAWTFYLLRCPPLSPT